MTSGLLQEAMTFAIGAAGSLGASIAKDLVAEAARTLVTARLLPRIEDFLRRVKVAGTSAPVISIMSSAELCGDQ